MEVSLVLMLEKQRHSRHARFSPAPTSPLATIVEMVALPGVTRGQPHVYVITAISLAEFMFVKKGQWVAGVVGKGRFSLVDFLPKIKK
jgi:hypothetical protein